MTENRETAFAALVDTATACRLCPRMEHVRRVLGWGNGSLAPRIMFVGEAPGRLGAEQTGLPFHGDVAGNNFERLLSASGLSRNDAFVTNAVLCNPQKEDGTNDTPTRAEIANCSKHLEAQIKLLDPKFVAPLGAKALAALDLIEPHGLELSAHVRTARLWFNRVLVPLYHPGQRAMVHRNFANQLADYYFLSSLLRPARSTAKSRVSVEALSLVRWLLRAKGPTSLFALHKLLFLTEVEAVASSGKRMTTLYFIRQKDGPYCTDLASLARQRGPQVESFISHGKVWIRESARASDLFEQDEEISLPHEIEVALRRTVETLGSLTDAQLKQRSYRSVPMRRMLRLERDGVGCLNRPLLTDQDVMEMSAKAAA